jgi:hypothetical protein
LLCLVLTVSDVLAQPRQAHRFEEPIESDEQGFIVISLAKEGLALIREKESKVHRKKDWQLEIVDTTLTKVWSHEMELDSYLVLVGYEYNYNHLYLLFKEGETYLHDFRLITLDFKGKVVASHTIKFEVDFTLTHFIMAGQNAVFGGYVSGEPAILLYDQVSTHPKVLPGLFIREMKLLDLRANQNASFNVLLVESFDKEKTNLVVRTFDNNGGLIFDDMIKVDPRFHILTGLTSTLERDELVVAGTYSLSKSLNAAGIFSAVVDPYGDQVLNYNDFGNMEHFLDYLPPKRAYKVKEKAKRLRSAGQTPSYSNNVIPFRLEERKDGFYLLAEVYSSSSVNSSYSSANNPYFSNPYSYGYYPFGMNPYSSRYYNAPYMGNTTSGHSDVHMIEAVVIKIGVNGAIEKDASMKFNNIRQDNLEQTGDFVVRDDSILLLYKKNNEIFYKSAMGDSLDRRLDSPSKFLLYSKHEYMKTEHDKEGTTRHWYDNHLYVWGYQQIKDPTRKSLDKTRRVFYVNRISME